MEGKGMGDRRQALGADALVKSPAGIPHLWPNTSYGPFLVLVLKLFRSRERTRTMS
jgi:hypothetical protein